MWQAQLSLSLRWGLYYLDILWQFFGRRFQLPWIGHPSTSNPGASMDANSKPHKTGWAENSRQVLVPPGDWWAYQLSGITTLNLLNVFLLLIPIPIPVPVVVNISISIFVFIPIPIQMSSFLSSSSAVSTVLIIGVILSFYKGNNWVFLKMLTVMLARGLTVNKLFFTPSPCIVGVQNSCRHQTFALNWTKELFCPMLYWWPPSLPIISSTWWRNRDKSCQVTKSLSL